MIEFIKSDTKWDFVSKFKYSVVISGLLVLASLIGVFTHLNYGVDFRGGAEIQVKFAQAVSLEDIRKLLSAEGFKGVTAQTIGELEENEVLVKVVAQEENLNEVTHQIEGILSKSLATSGVDIRKVDIVGPKAGAQLRTSGFQAMVWALLAIMIYIALRFDFKYSPGAIVALFHDAVIILGIFAFFNIEFTLQIVAAILAVIGYSVNDTVIVYDRVREHEAKFTGLPLKDHINNAINDTLSRTILTTGTTLFVSLTMYLFGGLAIRDFFFAISLGCIIGTYSTIFIASPVTLFFDQLKQRKKGK